MDHGPYDTQAEARAVAKRIGAPMSSIQKHYPKHLSNPHYDVPPHHPLVTRVENWLKQNSLDYDARVYTQAAWRARGEPYGNDAVITITTEGPLYELLNWGSTERAYVEQEKFKKFLKSLGFYYELGHPWSVHLYPLARANPVTNTTLTLALATTAAAVGLGMYFLLKPKMAEAATPAPQPIVLENTPPGWNAPPQRQPPPPPPPPQTPPIVVPQPPSPTWQPVDSAQAVVLQEGATYRISVPANDDIAKQIIFAHNAAAVSADPTWDPSDTGADRARFTLTVPTTGGDTSCSSGTHDDGNGNCVPNTVTLPIIPGIRVWQLVQPPPPPPSV